MLLTDFIHQKTYEHIVYSVRRHWATFVPMVFVFVLLLLVPVGVRWLIGVLFPNFLEGPIAFPLTVLFAGVYYLSVILFFYSFFITFYLDLLIVTNDRLIDISQSSLFARTVSEVDLYKIEDVTSEVIGFFPSLFNYGTLTIETAGALPKFVISDIPNPDGLRQALLDLSEADRKYHSQPAV